MIEANADPDSAKAEAPPLPPEAKRAVSWPEWITAAFTVVLAGATLALVGTAWFQHKDAVEAIEATQRLAQATENAATDRQRISSAELILKFSDILERPHYARILTDIESHGSNYPLLPRTKKGRLGNRTDADVEEYIGIFEDVGYFIEDNLIIAKWPTTISLTTSRKLGAIMMYKELYGRPAPPTKARLRKPTRCTAISKS